MKAVPFAAREARRLQAWKFHRQGWSQRAIAVKKEVAVHAIAYNLVRALMQQAAHVHKVALARLSFAGSLAAINHWAAPLHAAAGQPRRQRQLLAALLSALAGRDNRVAARPGRTEPRARKRRAKNYQLLTQARRRTGNLPHRNRP